MLYPTEKRLVSIGLPVYNGEDYIDEALQSLLDQTYENIEIIVSDNCSTDQTEHKVKKIAQKDNRIFFYKNKKNYGASYNFNLTVKLSKGSYFKWASHDDVCDQKFIESCMDVLEQDDSAVLAYTDEIDIDDQGNFIRERPYQLNGFHESPVSRLRSLFKCERGSPPIFGVFKKRPLLTSSLIGSYDASD